ncbi:winged helix-turn-helix transcriptional regulator [Citrobacter amalonaticus]|uniref:winged helix-turn-helix transcriptional regulator n=1 Tax=Citrobacter amalonaticus TaxID=35703 RepID=UPI0019073A57|nr:winged helix-turn-helix transcriptional regulator [Citrobacter amalonaticus]MBJ9257269.1 winged helix-turn-helix transcriptional regulator [Citrobacter amalonaticus]
MNAREKILHHLETNNPTSAAEFQKITQVPKSRVNQILRELKASGQIESYQSRGLNHFRLTELHKKRQQIILEWFDSGRSGTSADVATDVGLDITLVYQILASLSKQGEVHREWLGRERVWMYRKAAPHIFGLANPLTAFINQRLKEVRAPWE